MKKGLQKTLQTTPKIWAMLILESVIASLLYSILNVAGISKSTSFFITFSIAVVLAILGLLLFRKSLLLVRNEDEIFMQKLPVSSHNLDSRQKQITKGDLSPTNAEPKQPVPFIWGAVGAVLAIIAILITILTLPQATLIRQALSQTFSGTPAATAPSTTTSSPTPILITITKNLDIRCISCGVKLDIKLTTIVIDTTKQKSTWNFTLTNNSNPIDSLSFTTVVLEDNTGQKHQGGGLASTDSWNMSSGQSIQTYATFDVVHGTNYSLNIMTNYGTYQTETITF